MNTFKQMATEIKANERLFNFSESAVPVLNLKAKPNLEFVEPSFRKNSESGIRKNSESVNRKNSELVHRKTSESITRKPKEEVTILVFQLTKTHFFQRLRRRAKKQREIISNIDQGMEKLIKETVSRGFFETSGVSFQKEIMNLNVYKSHSFIYDCLISLVILAKLNSMPQIFLTGNIFWKL